MLAPIRLRHLALAGLLFCTNSSLAHGQSACGQLGVDCTHPSSSSGSSGGSASGANYPAVGEILGLPGSLKRAHEQAKAKKATALNEQGLAAYENGDWSAAEAFFKKASRLNPKSDVISANLAAAQRQIASAQYAQQQRAAAEQQRAAENLLKAQREQQQRIAAEQQRNAENLARARHEEEQRLAAEQQKAAEKLAADQMHPSIQDVSQSPTAAPSSGKLDFSEAQLTQGSQKCTFGTICNPENPNLTSRPAPGVGSDTKAGDQLLSAAATAKNHGDLTANFDVGGAPIAGSLNVPSPSAQTSAAAKLAAQIPIAAQKDEVVKQSMAYYQKLDNEKLDTQVKLAEVQKQIDEIWLFGKGDSTILNAQKSTLNNDLKRYGADQATTQAQIKERVLKIGLPWNESPAPAETPKP